MTAALIGPAAHITERVQDFSAFDVVARMNYALPIPEAVKRATGGRCDWVYLWQRPLDDVPTEALADVRQFRLHPDVKRVPYQLTDRVSPIPMALFAFMVREMGTRPNMGLLAMADLLDQGFTLYVTGVTFFRSGYQEGYHPPDGEAMLRTSGNYLSHRQEPQLEYFRKYIAPRISMDPELAEIAAEGVHA